MNEKILSSFDFSFVESPVTTIFPRKKIPYRKAERPKVAAQSEEKRAQNVETPEPTWPVSKLSTGAQLSLGVLGLHAVMNGKDGSVRLSDVKKCFRRMARKLHPDLNPSAKREEFLRAKEAAQILIDEITQLQKAA